MQDSGTEISTENSDIIPNTDQSTVIRVADEKNNKPKQVRFKEDRRKWIRNNFITTFYKDGNKSISKIFPGYKSPDKVKWDLISSKLHRTKKNGRDTKRVNLPLTQGSGIKTCYSVTENPVQSKPLKEMIRSISLLSTEEIISDFSILSSYPILAMIEEYTNTKVNYSQDNDDGNMKALLKQCISNFVDTCERQIKNVIMRTNDYLGQYVDLNGRVLTTGQQTFIKVHTIPVWTHIRILEDTTNQRFIALKNSNSRNWFALSQKDPLPNQRWICYPITYMNTLENELNMAKENTLNWMILQMLMLKCFNRIYKNDMAQMKFDIDNILLVSSNCCLIVVFKEGQHEFDISSFDILQTESLADVPNHCFRAKAKISETVLEFFYHRNIIPLLISSLWPIDKLAYILAKLITKL